MILAIPTPPIQYEPASAIAMITSHYYRDDHPHTANLVTTVMLHTDLVSRPFIEVRYPYDDATPMMFGLVLSFANQYTIAIESRYREVLDYYLDSVLADTDVTVGSTKTKFTELFV